MKLIYKTLHRKQMFLHGMLILLLLLSVISLQITATVFTKNRSIAQRVLAMDVATTNIIYPLSNLELNEYLQEYKQNNDFEYTQEETLVWPYHAYSTSWMKGRFPLYLEGYVASDANYPLLEGKELKTLSGNEIGVMEAYARSLRKQGIEPLGHTVTITGFFEEKHSFIIRSVFEYPNYDDGYANQSNMKAIEDYQIMKPAVGVANPKTLEAIEADYVKTYGVENSGWTLSRLLKLQLHEYTDQLEYQFRQDAMNDDRSYRADYRLLVDEMNGNTVQDGIFRFVSLSVSGCLVLSCLFVLFAFMKRKLLEDSEKLSILIANGITKRNIQKAYALEYARLFAIVLGFLVIFDVCLQFVLSQQNNYVLRLLFSLSSYTLLYFVPSVIIFFAALSVMLLWQVRSYYRGSLSRSIKGKHLHVNGKRHLISFRFQSLHMASREIKTRPFSALRSMLSISIIFLTILLLGMTNSMLSHLYTPQTFGLQFDYQLAAGVPYDDFMELKDQYFQRFSFLEGEGDTAGIDKTFFVDDRSTRDTVDFRYYPGINILLTGALDDFVPLHEGKYPTPVGAEAGIRSMVIQQTLVPRRLQHDFDKYIYDSEYVKQHPEVSNDTYSESSNGWGVGGNKIRGFTESIANQGFVTFSCSNMSALDRAHYPTFPKTLLILKDASQKAEFEAALKEKGIVYDSYDTVLQILQNNNDDLNLKLHYVMLIVAGMSMLVLMITLYANVRADQVQQRPVNTCYAQIGLDSRLRRRKDILYQGMILIGAVLMALLLYAILQYPYFNMLGIYLGLYQLPKGATWIFYVIGVAAVFGIAVMLLSSYKRVRKS